MILYPLFCYKEKRQNHGVQNNGVGSVLPRSREIYFYYQTIYPISKNVYMAMTMRTNIVIDDELMEEALKATGLITKKEAVELGLKTLVRLKKQERIRRFKGKLSWEGDLEAQRTTR